MNTWCRGGSDGAQYGVTPKVSFRICSIFIRIYSAASFQEWIDRSMFDYQLENMFTSSLNTAPTSDHMSDRALQPLDVVLFNNVKADCWCSAVKNHLKDGNKCVKKHDFPRLIKKLFIDKHSFSPCRIVSSFARAGKRNSYRSKCQRAGLLSVQVYGHSTTIPTITSTFTLLPNNILLPRVLSPSPPTATPLT